MRLDHLLSRETSSDEIGRTDSKVERRELRKKKRSGESHEGTKVSWFKEPKKASNGETDCEILIERCIVLKDRLK